MTFFQRLRLVVRRSNEVLFFFPCGRWWGGGLRVLFGAGRKNGWKGGICTCKLWLDANKMSCLPPFLFMFPRTQPLLLKFFPLVIRLVRSVSLYLYLYSVYQDIIYVVSFLAR